MKKANQKQKTAPIILWVLFVVYLFVLLRITLFRNTDAGVRSFNVVPFTTILEYGQFITSGNKIIGISNLAGNLIIFFPLGYMAALLFPQMRKLTRTILFVVSCSVAIEISQYIFRCGSTDIDDVILNTLGGLLGYCFYFMTIRILKLKKYAIIMSMLMTALTGIVFFSFNNYRFLIDRPAPGEIRNQSLNAQPETDYYTAAITTDDGQMNTHELEINVNTDVNMASPVDLQSHVSEAAWSLVLVNKWNYIPDDFEVDLVELSSGQFVDKRIYPALQEMLETAKDDGVYPIVVSGYRTADEQQRLMDEKISAYSAEGYLPEEAIANAESWVATPGTSEHQLGLAVDINADGIHSAGYEVYSWLNQNAYHFGFICRYPSDKTELTGVANEPWHYRYVGIEAATDMQSQGICLEEYLNGIQ